MGWVVALQVRNLASCVKVAVDFVLPESLDQAFKFAKDFANMAKSEAWETDQSSGERVYVGPVNRQHADKLQAELSMCLAVKHAMELLNGKPQGVHTPLPLCLLHVNGQATMLLCIICKRRTAAKMFTQHNTSFQAVCLASSKHCLLSRQLARYAVSNFDSVCYKLGHVAHDQSMLSLCSGHHQVKPCD